MLNSVESEMLPFKARGLSEMYRFLGNVTRIIDESNKDKFRILEIGCGFGQVMIELIKIYGNRLEICGINRHKFDGDLELAVRVAKYRGIISDSFSFNKEKIKFIYCDAGSNLPFDEDTFDFVFSQMAIMYVEDKIKLIEETSRVMKPDGVALLHTAFERKIYDNQWKSSLEIYDGKLLIETESYFKLQNTITFLDKPRGKILKIDSGKQLDFNLKLDSVIHLEEIDSSLFGTKSKYIVKNVSS